MNLATMGYDDPNFVTSPFSPSPLCPPKEAEEKRGLGERGRFTPISLKLIVWMANRIKTV